jgi:hypothetical protein
VVAVAGEASLFSRLPLFWPNSFLSQDFSPSNLSILGSLLDHSIWIHHCDPFHLDNDLLFYPILLEKSTLFEVGGVTRKKKRFRSLFLPFLPTSTCIESGPSVFISECTNHVQRADQVSCMLSAIGDISVAKILSPPKNFSAIEPCYMMSERVLTVIYMTGTK